VRLSRENSEELPDWVEQPRYDLDQPAGIVHFGFGAFHRAHQAWYTDACLNAGEQGWGIVGVSLRSPSVARQVNPQDGLYTLTERSAEGSRTRLIGAVREVLVAAEDRDRIVAAIASLHCHIVSFTVTEKGYCRASDGSLDFALAESGFYPILAEALRKRMRADTAGLTLLSCDNLSGNGKQLGRLMREWLETKSPDLVDWFAENCTTPDSMVDRIVPATTEADLAELEQRIGLREDGAVFTEPFSHWVIEDNFAGLRPHWEDRGGQIVPDVAPYETAKLRMLNGAHSFLAYAGLDAGHTYVHEAIADPTLRALVERLMREEAAPTIAAGQGQDLAAYADALLARFANPALNHELIQIAMDGSQKIPQRWLEVLAAHGDSSIDCCAILTGIAHWLNHVRGDVRAVDDPIAEVLAAAWREHGGEGIVDAVLARNGVLASDWEPSAAEKNFIVNALPGVA